MSEEDVHKMVIDTSLDVKAEFQPGATILRRILTPNPANMLCYSMVEYNTLIQEVFATWSVAE